MSEATVKSFKHSKRTGARGKRKPKEDAGTPLLDLAASQEARDAALEQVSTHAGTEFMKLGLLAIAQMSKHIDVSGEDIRIRLIAKDIRPHHPNAWGALTRAAVKMGLLIDTGLWKKMSDARSHARRTPIYRVAGL